MDKNALKIELIQKIIACDDEDLLLKMVALLKNVKPGASEPGGNYEVESRSSQLSKEQLKEIDERNKAYLKGNLETESLETFSKKIFEKYGV
ncbi:hypothetical protein [uncultured Salegentibacter sp.]|uniref:hypothetical protein n=1 Tax=uncultured Salegentibacter sp. TaxID=259320 RepID=UPI0025946832|nr:hypothetical protein [uncultured Salegentibacter sp.]